MAQLGLVKKQLLQVVISRLEQLFQRRVVVLRFIQAFHQQDVVERVHPHGGRVVQPCGDGIRAPVHGVDADARGRKGGGDGLGRSHGVVADGHPRVG